MKKKLLPLLLLFITNITNAQSDSSSNQSIISEEKQRPLKAPRMATLTLTDGTKQKGWLYQLNDSQVVLLDPVKSKVKNWSKGEFIPSGSFTVGTDQVNSISLRKKNAGLKGMLIGMGVGIFSGVVIGLASGDDPITPYNGDFGDVFIAIGNAFAMTAEEKAVAGAAAFGTGGAILGLIIGSVAKKKIIIGGKKDKVRDLHAELVKRNIIPH